ncbi:MAG: hypothetical protein ACFCGT_26950 [Sandaracinaceae bacterium]
MRTFLVALLSFGAAAGCGGDPSWEPAFLTAADPDEPGYARVEPGWLMNVWALSPTEVFAVGGDADDGTGGRILRSDGDGWADVDHGLAVPLLNWITGFGPDDLWVVGVEGTMIHHDGSTWARVEVPTQEDLWGIWGAAPDDIWAVGGSGRSGAEAILLRYDGSAWSQVPLPELDRERVRALFKVWGTSADNVYAVGQRGVLLRFDGSAWSQIVLPDVADDLIALWGSDPDHITVVGGRGNGVVAVWNGAEWRTARVSPTPGLNGVWMRDPRVAHVVGEPDFISGGVLATLDLETLELTLAEPPRLAEDRRTFHAVHGVDGRLYAVGGNLAKASNEPSVGIAFTRLLRNDE